MKDGLITGDGQKESHLECRDACLERGCHAATLYHGDT